MKSVTYANLMSHFQVSQDLDESFQVSQDLDESFQVSQDLDEVWTARFVRPARLQWEGLVNDNSVGCAWQCMPGLMHVIDSTAQQNSCLTRAEYLAVLCLDACLTPRLSGP